uniref:Uncharacterized protein n=1 Tax=Sphaerodactylus townsendi TaxID=933632 RepID=A0ACB8FAX6_9SAUR
MVEECGAEGVNVIQGGEGTQKLVYFCPFQGWKSSCSPQALRVPVQSPSMNANVIWAKLSCGVQIPLLLDSKSLDSTELYLQGDLLRGRPHQARLVGHRVSKRLTLAQGGFFDLVTPTAHLSGFRPAYL